MMNDPDIKVLVISEYYTDEGLSNIITEYY